MEQSTRTGRRAIGTAVVIASFAFATLFVGRAMAAAPFVVNTTADGPPDACDATECTLREAILAANANPGLDTIAFNIGTGLQTISPSANLPPLTDPVVLDGTTQPGFSGPPIIELDGSNIGPASIGLTVSGGSSTIRGLVINRFGIDAGTGWGAIVITDLGANRVEGNFLGTDPTGTLALGNGSGVTLDSSENIIGGAAAGQRNVISANNIGIDIRPDTSGNVVAGNFIGTNATGTAVLGNILGIHVDGSFNTIGGTTPGARNVISGNWEGIRVDRNENWNGTGNIVQGNFIGTDVTGMQDLGNRFGGVVVNGANSTIGGTAPGAGNVISNNGGQGVYIAPLAIGSRVQGNLIGTDVRGSLALGNDRGILVESASGNLIGGNTPSAGNVLAHNEGSGVVVFNGGSGNTIMGNTIHSNGSLGIDLGNNGVTPNDSGDADAGSNDQLNFPVLTAVSPTSISGAYNSFATATFRLEFFSSAACDESAHGEGERFLGFTNVTTDVAGNAQFSFNPPSPIAAGHVATATATDGAGNTSEFAACHVRNLPTPANKGDCKDVGWQNVSRADGSAFKNQGDCVQYVATGK